MIEHLLHPQLVQALGWTLLHSLWQGAAFALLLASLLIALRSYTAQARYTVAAGLLAAFFITVGGTFWQQWQQADLNHPQALVEATSTVPSTSAFAKTLNNEPATSSLREQSNKEAASSPVWKSATQTFSKYYSDHLPLLVTFWLMGVLILQLRFLGQLAFVQRLKHYGTKAFPPEWSQKIEALEAKLRIQKKVVYRTTLRTSSPMVIGWLKPVVLFPQLMLNKLSETEIYAVLAHELAHVRRDDFAVNLLQTLLTNVFFFHPGIWWMSNHVDEEREHCCDDLAILATGEAMPYAKTLLNVSQMHRTSAAGQPQLAMAMSGTDRRKKGSGFADARRPVGLRDRVKRLFSANSGAGTFREGFATACILFAGLGMAFAFTNQTEVPLADRLDELAKTRRLKSSGAADTFPVTAMRMNVPDGAPPPAPAPPIAPVELSAPIPSAPPAAPRFPLAPAPPIAPAELSAPMPPEPPKPPSDEARLTFGDRPGRASQSNTRFPYGENSLLPDLLAAVRQGQLEAVQQLIDQGAPTNGVYTDPMNGYETPLMVAASENELAIATLLIRRGAEVNATVNNWTPLLEAADEGAIEVLNLFLSKGADINWHQGPNTLTALAMAASEGNMDCVLALLKAGADINGFGESLPPLHAAAKEGKTDIMRALITRGAEVNQEDAIGRTALMYAANEGLGDPVALLVSSKADPNLTDYTGMRALEFALEEGAQDLANFLGLITVGPACATHLKDGHTHAHTKTDPDVNVDGDASGEYLRWQMGEQNRNKAAIQRAAEKEARDQQENQSALKDAILRGDAKLVGLLLENGADPEGSTFGTWTPLHLAALEGNAKIMDLLLAKGPTVDARTNYSSSDGSPESSLVAWDYEGATPLLIAIENSKYECIRLLLQAGANPDARLKKIEFTRVEADANGFGLSQVTNVEARPRKMNTTSKTYEDWSPRRQAQQQNDPKLLALLK